MTSPHYRFRFHCGPDLRALPSGNYRPGLLSEGIFDANIDADGSGNVRITLWREWHAMLTDLRRVGPVWSIVRNDQCTLAVMGDYPQLNLAPDQQSAMACGDDNTLTCHFRAWRNAVAFDSQCHCGRLYGVEIKSRRGHVFHRVCLTKSTALAPFVEWVHLHQATGLEEEEEFRPADENESHLQSIRLAPGALRLAPGALEVPLARLRTTLIHAAQREISLIAAITGEGMTQTARIDILRAGESQGWLVLSGNHHSLYVTCEPTGSLLAEPATLDGETVWRLSLIDPRGHRLLHLQSDLDHRPTWNRLIREFVLCSSTR